MPRPTAGVAVLLASGAPLLPDSDPALHLRLTSAGLDASRLAHAEAAEVAVQLADPSGWESLNLAALVAAARARPGATIALHLPERQAPAALAIHGSRELLTQPPAWRLEWPGPGRPTTALLDRDGTIIEDRHYLSDPDGVALLPGAAEGLRNLSALGMRLVVVSNQSGVALGRIRPVDLAAVNARLRKVLIEEGVQLAGIFCCPHHPDLGCACRKPADGLARQAERQLGIDLGHVLVAGDKDSDLGLGRRLGAATFLMLTGEGRTTLSSGGPPADYLVEDLGEVARLCAHPAGLGRPHLVHGDGAPLHG
jgi:D-glycero-D-manno-heptose 1,7-bisphosphate phosphatase